MNRTRHTTFKVNDMTCGHCVSTVRSALEKNLPGADVDIDLAAARVHVTGDPDIAENAIREAGYTPERSEQAE